MMKTALVSASSGSAFGLAFVTTGSESFYLQGLAIGALIVAAVVGELLRGRAEHAIGHTAHTAHTA